MAKRVARIGRECVACGCCALVCPKQAIIIYRGVSAQVDGEKCIGCGRCEKACPAGVIFMEQREREL